MPGREHSNERNSRRQPPGARRKPSGKEEPSSDQTHARSPREEDLARVLSLSHEERSAAIRELQRRYGNQRVQRMLARLVQPDAAESEDPNRVSSDVTDRIAAQQGSGQPLDADTRSEMESNFGQDFSDVRVHTSPEADSLNQDVEAKAFTTGSDIFFRGGNYSPGSSEGQELLAHELTHVVQQQGATTSSSGPARVTSPDDASEVEAAKVAEAVVGQGGVSRQAEEEEEPPAAMARQEEDDEMMAARQAEEEEEPPAAMARQEEDDEMMAARQAEEEEEPPAAMARQEEEEEAMAARQVEEEEEPPAAMARQEEEEEAMAARQSEGEIARQATEEDVQAEEDRWVALMEHIASGTEGKKPKEKSEYEEALKTTGKALLETGTGKQLKEQAKQVLLSKKGAPLTITLGAGALAALMATKAEVPSIPIPLSENMDLTIDVKGSLDKPDGVMATFKMRF